MHRVPGGEVSTKEVELGEKQDFSRLKFPASGKSLKKEPAWCAQEMTELRYVGRMSEEEVEKISGVKGKACRAL